MNEVIKISPAAHECIAGMKSFMSEALSGNTPARTCLNTYLKNVAWIVFIIMLPMVTLDAAKELRYMAYFELAKMQIAECRDIAQSVHTQKGLVAGSDFPSMALSCGYRVKKKTPWTTNLTYKVTERGLVMSFHVYDRFCRYLAEYFLESSQLVYIDGKPVGPNDSAKHASCSTVAGLVWERPAGPTAQ